MQIITISGKAGAGKDTLAIYLKEYIETTTDREVIVAHFADYLKYICRNFFNWNGRKDDYGRHLLQYVGTDIFRAQNENFWVDSLFNILQIIDRDKLVVIIPDARFPNEIEKAKELFPGALSIKIVRPNHISSLSNDNQKHSSETALDNYHFDLVVISKEGFDNFASKAKTVVDYLIVNFFKE